MKLADLQMSLFDWFAPQQPSPVPVATDFVVPTVSQTKSTDIRPIHPQSNRWVEFEGRKLHYYLRRSRRRTIGLQVGSDGLVVSAPQWALVGDIVKVVMERSAWAVEKLREVSERDEAFLREKIEWQDGVSIPYLGQSIQVRLDPTAKSETLFERDGVTQLSIRLRPDANPTQIREKVQAWLVKQAKELYAQRLDHYAPRLAVTWKRLRLSQARTRWGSANSHGTICLNWRLIHHALPVIDYVIVHELSHLRVMNHSSAFWDTVASVMPDYKQSMQVLKKETLPPW